MADNGLLETDQATCLKANGYGTSASGDNFEISSFSEQLMSWEVEEEAVTVPQD